MRERTKIIYRGWNKEIFILQGNNIHDNALRQMAEQFYELYPKYNILVIPIEVEFEFR